MPSDMSAVLSGKLGLHDEFISNSSFTALPVIIPVIPQNDPLTHVQRDELADLVADERLERRYDHRDAGVQQRRKLIAQTLTAAWWPTEQLQLTARLDTLGRTLRGKSDACVAFKNIQRLIASIFLHTSNWFSVETTHNLNVISLSSYH